MNGESNIKRHEGCSIRNELGNCCAVGGFCNSVSEEICEAILAAYKIGWLAGAKCAYHNSTVISITKSPVIKEDGIG